MSQIFTQIRELVQSGRVKISEHGYDELANDNLNVKEIIDGIDEAVLLEEYLDYPKGSSILVLQTDMKRRPVHIVWGIPKGYTEPAVLVTAYRPDATRWDKYFMKRKQ